MPVSIMPKVPGGLRTSKRRGAWPTLVRSVVRLSRGNQPIPYGRRAVPSAARPHNSISLWSAQVSLQHDAPYTFCPLIDASWWKKRFHAPDGETKLSVWRETPMRVLLSRLGDGGKMSIDQEFHPSLS